MVMRPAGLCPNTAGSDPVFRALSSVIATFLVFYCAKFAFDVGAPREGDARELEDDCLIGVTFSQSRDTGHTAAPPHPTG